MSERAAHLKDEGSRTQVVLAGMVAGLVSRFVVAPLDVVKIRLQLQSHPPRNSHSTGNSLPNPPKSPVYRGALDTIITIAQQEGITALWKGNIPAEALYILYGGVQFTTYRSTTALLHSLPPPLPPSLHPSLESFLSGASAGLAATFATYPLDLLRTRFAAQGTRRVYSGLFHAIRHIAAEEGGRGFFRGCGAAVASVVPYMGLFFSAYESLRIPLAHVHLPFGSGDATAGVLASVMAKTGTFPLDLVRKRLQVQGPTRVNYVHGDIPQYSGGVLGTMRVIVLQEGFRGLYRGLVVSLVKAAPTSAVTMWTYERVLKAMLEFEKGERVETH